MKMLTMLLLCSVLSVNIIAQATQANDVILKVNGDELKGKVTEIGDSEIKFIYTGETLVYSIKKTDILKITYASGRVETYNKPALPSTEQDSQKQAEKSTVDHHNRVAILPFGFISDNQSAAEDMKYKVQAECYTYLTKHAGELTILDPRTTNALLIKAGATADKMMGFTMDELCAILGVEYIIDGTITANKADQHSYESGSYKATGDNNNKDGKSDAKISGSSSSTTTQSFKTSISMNIYTDANKNIFSQDHDSFWSTADAYKITLQYLLKKSPLYTK